MFIAAKQMIHIKCRHKTVTRQEIILLTALYNGQEWTVSIQNRSTESIDFENGNLQRISCIEKNKYNIKHIRNLNFFANRGKDTDCPLMDLHGWVIVQVTAGALTKIEIRVNQSTIPLFHKSIINTVPFYPFIKHVAFL